MPYTRQGDAYGIRSASERDAVAFPASPHTPDRTFRQQANGQSEPNSSREGPKHSRAAEGYGSKSCSSQPVPMGFGDQPEQLAAHMLLRRERAMRLAHSAALSCRTSGLPR